MGLLTTYLIYKSGKRRGAAKARAEEQMLLCNACGRAPGEHLLDEVDQIIYCPVD